MVELVPPNMADEANHFWLAPFRSRMGKRNKRGGHRRHKTQRAVCSKSSRRCTERPLDTAAVREGSRGGGQGGLEASMEGVEGARCGAAREWPNMAGGAASWGINGGVAMEGSPAERPGSSTRAVMEGQREIDLESCEMGSTAGLQDGRWGCDARWREKGGGRWREAGGAWWREAGDARWREAGGADCGDGARKSADA
jgi:hypothetical protein